MWYICSVGTGSIVIFEGVFMNYNIDELCIKTATLEEETVYLKPVGSDCSLLEATLELGHIAILNFKNLKEVDLNGISTSLDLALSVCEAKKKGVTSIAEGRLDELVGMLKDSFIVNGFIIDEIEEKKIIA